jgi:hypothetical protein
MVNLDYEGAGQQYIEEEIDAEELKAARKKIDLFKQIIPSILVTGKYELDPELENKYPAFMVNRTLSQYSDCLHYAVEMSLRPGIPNRIHYTYLLNTVKKYTRKRSSWAKKPEVEFAVDIVAKYSNVTKRQAAKMLPCLTVAQVEYMKKTLDPGG